MKIALIALAMMSFASAPLFETQAQAADPAAPATARAAAIESFRQSPTVGAEIKRKCGRGAQGVEPIAVILHDSGVAGAPKQLLVIEEVGCATHTTQVAARVDVKTTVVHDDHGFQVVHQADEPKIIDLDSLF